MCWIPSVRLNNGSDVPIIGLGTWRSPPEMVIKAVKDAIKIGYRHLDCAYIYGNETEIGIAIAAKIEEGAVKREDLFITSKLWNTYHHPEMVRQACELTLQNLGISYLDCYLMHWPTTFEGSGEPYLNEWEATSSDVGYLETWLAMEELVDDGLCRTIGISNFNQSQVELLLAVARIQPAILQIECHPYLNQLHMMEYCRANQIAITAHSPLGTVHSSYKYPGECVLLQHPKVNELAAKYNKSPAQILLKYQVQRGNIVIPRLMNGDHITANLEIFDFELNNEDIIMLNNLDYNSRYIMDADANHPEHPFDCDDEIQY